MNAVTTQAMPVVAEESHDIPIVELFVVAESGSAHDAPGREGSLNLALRSLRRGAAGRAARLIDEEIDRLGAELTTSADATSATIHATVIRRNLPPFLDLLADVVARPDFPATDVAQVAREIRADIIDSRDDDRTLAARHFRRTVFAGHPFGRPVTGTPATLNHLTRDDAARAYRATFQSRNVVVAGAGDITEAELRGFAARLGKMPSAAPPSRAVPEPRERKGRHLVIVDKPARTQTQVYIGALGTHPRDRDHMALRLGNTIFGGTFTARLMNEVRSKRGWSYGAWSRLGRDRAREAWSMWTFPAATDAPACIGLQIELLEKLLEGGVSAREVSFARSYLTRSFAFERDTAAKRLWHTLDVRLLDLPKTYYSKFVERIEAVTQDEVNAALRRRLSADDLVITVVATASELRGPLEKAIPDLASVKVIPYDAD